MDTLYNYKFKVEIYQNDIRKVEKLKFFDSEKKCFDNRIACIEENRITEMLFDCEYMDSKLYMDGLESLPEDLTKEDESGDVYISPSLQKISLFQKDFYPLIPGIFRIVIVIKDIKYYSLVEVKAKLITKNELDIIKEDLEKTVNGLAFELIRKNISLGNDKFKDAPMELYKFFVIQKNFSKVMSALADIRIRPNYKITKKYKIEYEDKVKSLDNITVKNYLNKSISEGFLKVPIKTFEYNLAENQWIKKIIKHVTEFLNKFINLSSNLIIIKERTIEELSKYSYEESNKLRIKEERKSVEYLNTLKTLAIKMKTSMNIIKSTEWYGEVTNNSGINIPHVLFSDSRYNAIYKLYKELIDSKFNIELDNKFTFQWRRTDELYEIWCYIKVCELIISKDFGFEIDGGWLFDNNINSKKVLIPELKSSSTVNFRKRDIRIKLIYDCEIPHHSEDTSLEKNPLYITSIKNKPDARLDIYKENSYIGSILLEFKYRNRKWLWKTKYEYYQSDTSVIKQLVSYGNNCSSIYLFKNDKNAATKFNKYIKPVSKVLILYPKGDNEHRIIDEVIDHNLKFIMFKPGEVQSLLRESIEKEIQELIERAEAFGI